MATNLAWIVDTGGLARVIGLDTVRLINDLEAIAHSLGDLGDADVALLQAGAPSSEGNRAIIAAGTGLGEAGAYWDGSRHHPFACEGGHGDFGPRTGIEMELLSYLLRKHDRVSSERVLSGSGLHEIYRFSETRAAATSRDGSPTSWRETRPRSSSRRPRATGAAISARML